MKYKNLVDEYEQDGDVYYLTYRDEPDRFTEVEEVVEISTSELAKVTVEMMTDAPTSGGLWEAIKDRADKVERTEVGEKPTGGDSPQISLSGWESTITYQSDGIPLKLLNDGGSIEAERVELLFEVPDSVNLHNVGHAFPVEGGKSLYKVVVGIPTGGRRDISFWIRRPRDREEMSTDEITVTAYVNGEEHDSTTYTVRG